METERVREYLLDFQKGELPEFTERALKVDGTRKIKSVIGPRRAGKTYFMFQKIKEIIKSGAKKENILYLNFEDPRLIDVNFKEIMDVVKVHWQLYPFSTKGLLHVFIDEPQNVSSWEVAARALHDNGFDVFLSGSSSKLLSREISTSLRGRTLSYMLLPFSFKEFLKAKNANLDAGRLSSREKSVLLSLLDEYLEFGGFPEVVLEKSRENKIRILNEYFNMIVYRDVIERHKVKNISLIKWLIQSLTSSFSKEFSVHKVYLTIKSKGVKVSKNTLYSYLSMLEDSVFAFFVPKFGYSVRKREFSINKAFLCDIGFAKLVGTSEDRSRKMENIVFLELERRRGLMSSVGYWKNQQQEEVDFVIKTGMRAEQLIQVCSDISSANVKKREVRALVKAGKELKCRNMLVVTGDYEGEEKYGGAKIMFMPLWKWLLS